MTKYHQHSQIDQVLSDLLENIRNGKFNEVEAALPNLNDNQKNRALVKAVNVDNPSIINLLLDNGADIHCQNSHPLIAAVHSGHISSVKLLLERGAGNTSDALNRVINVPGRPCNKVIMGVCIFRTHNTIYRI